MYVGRVMTRLEKIEKFFKMPFEEVISKLHIEQKISLLSLSKQSNVGRDAFQKECEKRGLKLRGIKEARYLSAQRGADHWAYGLTKHTHEMYSKHSERMLKNNPIHDKAIREKQLKSLSKAFAKNPLPQEVVFEKYLKSFNLKYVFQHPISGYIIDFFLPEYNVALEVDSTSKWCRSKKEMARLRDEKLLSIGVKTLRFNKDKLSIERITDILNANNIVVQS